MQYSIGSQQRSSAGSSALQQTILATHIVKYHFGEAAEKICDILISKASLTLQEIDAISGLPLPVIQNCLMILVQQNVVSSSAGAPTIPGAKKSPIQYSVNIRNILQRLKHSHYLTQVGKSLGADAEKLMSLLLEHGRLTFEQVYQFVEANAGDGEDRPNREQVFATFNTLIGAGFVQRALTLIGGVPAASLSASLMAGGASAAASSSKSTRGKRKQPETPVEIEETFIRPSKQATTSETSFMETELKGVVFIPNPLAFLWEHRRELFIGFIAERYGPRAANLIDALLQLVRHEYVLNKVDIKSRCTVDMGAIIQKLNTIEGREFNESEIRKMMNPMLKDNDPPITEVGGMFTPNLASLNRTIKKRHVELIFHHKFGTYGPRVLRTLLDKNHVEATALWDMVMVPAKDAQRVLYEMLSYNYVRYQEIARSFEAGATKKYYLWSVDLDKLFITLGNEACKTTTNLLLRLQVEKQRNYNLLGAGGEIEALQPQQRQQYDKIQRGIEALTTSMFRMVDTLEVLTEM